MAASPAGSSNLSFHVRPCRRFWGSSSCSSGTPVYISRRERLSRRDLDSWSLDVYLTRRRTAPDERSRLLYTFHQRLTHPIRILVRMGRLHILSITTLDMTRSYELVFEEV